MTKTFWSWAWEERSLVLRSGGVFKVSLTPSGPHGWLVVFGCGGQSSKVSSFAAALALALDALDLPAALRTLLEKDARALGVPGISPGESGASGVEYATLLGLVAAVALVAALAFGGNVFSMFAASTSSIDSAFAATASASDGQEDPDSPGEISIHFSSTAPDGSVAPPDTLFYWQPYTISASRGAKIANVSVAGLPDNVVSDLATIMAPPFGSPHEDIILSFGPAPVPGTYPIVITVNDTAGVSLSRAVNLIILTGECRGICP